MLFCSHSSGCGHAWGLTSTESQCWLTSPVVLVIICCGLGQLPIYCLGSKSTLHGSVGKERDLMNISPLPAGAMLISVRSGGWRVTARGRGFSLPGSRVLTSPGVSSAWSARHLTPARMALQCPAPARPSGQQPPHQQLLGSFAVSYEVWYLPVKNCPRHPRGQVSSKFRQQVSSATSWPTSEPRLCPPGLNRSLRNCDCSLGLHIPSSSELFFLLATQFPITPMLYYSNNCSF